MVLEIGNCQLDNRCHQTIRWTLVVRQLSDIPIISAFKTFEMEISCVQGNSDFSKADETVLVTKAS